MNYYEYLGVDVQCDFSALKKAYYKRAKECHPDHFADSPQKTEEFKHLVLAFSVLSDPGKREAYDSTLRLNCGTASGANIRLESGSVLDTDVDDTLEELLVGNRIPENTSLMTLFTDLQKTAVFMDWREAEDCFLRGRYRKALKLLESLVVRAPGNILYRVYLARTYGKFGKYTKARRQYHAAIALGNRRTPPLILPVPKRELDQTFQKGNPWFHRIWRTLFPKEFRLELSPDEQMRREANRAIANLEREERARKKRLSE